MPLTLALNNPIKTGFSNPSTVQSEASLQKRVFVKNQVKRNIIIALALNIAIGVFKNIKL